ncbi:hypothetical protein Sros_8632 [Streptosporangium roseum DSM 43021]|uniref:Uncharacterized protein n=2 Tax=Streptosporangium roseum TaxID=2001 RepID=D2B440_STRRD|nr:hypothetical protein Sros_8632 [Streptosporangium roseum DSM 43021]
MQINVNARGAKEMIMIKPFRIDIPQAGPDGLTDRPARTRRPDEVAGPLSEQSHDDVRTFFRDPR